MHWLCLELSTKLFTMTQTFNILGPDTSSVC